MELRGPIQSKVKAAFSTHDSQPQTGDGSKNLPESSSLEAQLLADSRCLRHLVPFPGRYPDSRVSQSNQTSPHKRPEVLDVLRGPAGCVHFRLGSSGARPSRPHLFVSKNMASFAFVSQENT